MCPNIRNSCQLGQCMVQSKVENLQFYLGGVIWVTRLIRCLQLQPGVLMYLHCRDE